jgi:Tol biopolymer transport system component
LDEASPFPLPERGGAPVLYFSSTRPGLGIGGDLYRSASLGNVFGPAQLVPGVNSAFDDGQPNLRRDGLELFFYSTRPDPDALGGPDLYVATRASTRDPWSTPVNLGPSVNSPASETRPSLSWDATTLYFGSTRTGSEAASADIYVTTREKLTGSP